MFTKEELKILKSYMMHEMQYTLYKYEFEDMYLEELEQALTTLKSGRAIRILRLLTGIEDGTNHKLKEIAAEYNVTPERIRQIKFKALRKLKLICERNMNYRVFDIEITEDNIKQIQTLMFDQFQKNLGYGWDYNVEFTTNSILKQMVKRFDESLAINYRKRK